MNSLAAFERHKKIIILVFVALIEILLSNSSFAQTTIEVFVDKALVVPLIPNANINVLDISRAELLQKNIPTFSPDATIAKSQATAWFASPEGKDHIAQVKEAYMAHQKMIMYGIQKIPAIVFEHGKFVVYGITDVRQAVADYDQFIRTHKNDLALTRDHSIGVQHE